MIYYSRVLHNKNIVEFYFPFVHGIDIYWSLLLLNNLNNCNFGEFSKTGDFSVIIMLVCTDEFSAIPRTSCSFAHGKNLK